MKNEEKKQIQRRNENEVDYVFDEGKYLSEIWNSIDKTYTSHYAQNKIQSTEFIADAGHGEGFCIGNIIKYAQRYGKKGGFNRNDLTKVAHYVTVKPDGTIYSGNLVLSQERSSVISVRLSVNNTSLLFTLNCPSFMVI